MAIIEGIDEFEDFADNVDDIDVQAAISRAERKIAEDFIDILTDVIDNSSTYKGGTFDSRTSPYAPGGTNDSSSDSLHITDEDAWSMRNDGNKVVVYPKEEVETRMKFLNDGTQDHPPDGDDPMHYFFNGFHIVVHDAPDPDTSPRKRKRYTQAKAAADSAQDVTAAEFRYGEPAEVAGVDEQNFLRRAGDRARQQNIVEENFNRELNREFQKAGVVFV